MIAESVEELATQAMRALEAERSVISEIDVPSRPGLYAVWADERTWTYLGLERSGSRRPLYVGKAERSLQAREFGTHFNAIEGSAARTGSSTVRRSFVALLAPSMGLRAVPRNPAKPGHFSNFALRPEDEVRLTAWMHEALRLSVWPKPDTVTVPCGRSRARSSIGGTRRSTSPGCAHHEGS
ncbi:hypothetical protein P9139_11780 [Curtobacterium flaccumfaciens]|nr:hypothetical protein P9139_11780 [Curtobacterium flaccumfaciens]